MSLSGLLLFAAVYWMAVASPGPAVTAVVARVLAKGRRGLPAFIAGFALGDLVWFGFAATGLSMLAQQFHALFLAVKYAGAAYLLYLAVMLWRAPAAPAARAAEDRPEPPARLFLAGLALTLGNPKVMIFFMAILPTVVDLAGLSFAGGIEIAAIIACLISVTLGGYGLLADRARRFFASPKAMRIVNRVCGTALAGAAAAVAAR